MDAELGKTISVPTEKEKMKVKVCDKYCRGCYFYQGNDESSRCCSYYLITDKHRGCDAGTGCDKKVKRKRSMKPKEVGNGK